MSRRRSSSLLLAMASSPSAARADDSRFPSRITGRQRFLSHPCPVLRWLFPAEAVTGLLLTQISDSITSFSPMWRRRLAPCGAEFQCLRSDQGRPKWSRQRLRWHSASGVTHFPMLVGPRRGSEPIEACQSGLHRVPGGGRPMCPHAVPVLPRIPSTRTGNPRGY